MEQEQPPQFLDVPRLIEQSHPRRSPVRAWQLAGIFMLVVFASTYFSNLGGQAAIVTEIISGLAMFALVATMGVISWNIVRKTREEQSSVEAVDELIRLRRWPEAGMMIEQLLSRPTRTPQARAHGLIFLTSVLARYNRFEDAIAVQNYLLENLQFDPGTVHGLRLSRA